MSHIFAATTTIITTTTTTTTTTKEKESMTLEGNIPERHMTSIS